MYIWDYFTFYLRFTRIVVVPQKEEINESFIKHISPLGWEHINFVGQYNFDDNSNYDLMNNMRHLQEN